MVIFKKPIDLRFGVSLIPGTSNVLPADVSSFVVPDWKGFDITPYRTGATFMVPDVDFSWDKDATLFTLLQEGDTFGYNELLHVAFQPLELGSGNPVGDVDDCGCCGTWNQYPHTMRWTKRNQVTLVTQSFERKGRLEQNGSTLAGLNAQGNNLKAVWFESLPADLVENGQQVDIFNDQVLLMSDTVKNFVKGFFNARIWL